MARINLLPWREEQRRERQRHFMTTLFMTAVLGVVLVVLAGTVFEQRIKHQQNRNDMIKQEIGLLEARIARIDELERTRARLISRKRTCFIPFSTERSWTEPCCVRQTCSVRI